MTLIPVRVSRRTRRLKTLRVNHPGSWKPFAGELDGVAVSLIAAILARPVGVPGSARKPATFPCRVARVLRGEH
jgi:hypothetical protein